MGYGDGNFSIQTTIVTSSYPLDFAVGDINGDFKLDLVTIGSSDNYC